MSHYSSRTDLDLYWGADNIATWAAIDTSSNTTTNNLRIEAHRDYADAEIDAVGRAGDRAVPFVTAAGAVPVLIKEISVILWGERIELGRGVQDYDIESAKASHRTILHAARAREMLKRIYDGSMKLDGV